MTASGRRRGRRIASPAPAAHLLEEPEQALLDVVDSLLTKGVVVNGELILAIADVDLVYLRLSALLCAADRVVSRADDIGGMPRARLPRTRTRTG